MKSLIASVLKNLTWRTAAKWYIWAAGYAATWVTAQSDLPDWVPVAVGAGTLLAGWLKRQYPEPSATP